MAMWAPAISCAGTCIPIIHDVLFLNMEHSSQKNHMVDVTTAGVDVIHHEERLLGQR